MQENFRASHGGILSHSDGCKYKDFEVSHLDGTHESKATCEKIQS
jgi:hypothetical protein